MYRKKFVYVTKSAEWRKNNIEILGNLLRSILDAARNVNRANGNTFGKKGIFQSVLSINSQREERSWVRDEIRLQRIDQGFNELFATNELFELSPLRFFFRFPLRRVSLSVTLRIIANDLSWFALSVRNRLIDRVWFRAD